MKDRDKKIKIDIKEPEEKKEEINNIHSEDNEKIQEETEILKKQLEEYKDSLLRKAAEFENYKKRTETEFAGYFKYASEKIIRELLPVYDDLKRAIESVKKGETKDFETLKKGIFSLDDKLSKILKKEGLKEIDCLNKEFNVDTCDALLQLPKGDVKPNTVIEVVEKGFYFKDKILRHAKVIVSTEPETKQESN